jgi:hypothetical protein
MFALLFGSALGCSDVATIGGLCPSLCPSASCVAGACVADSGTDGCAGAACAIDAGSDACAADGCRPDAGPVCSQGAYELTRMRLDLVLVVDDAASLVPWWPALREGLDQFLQQAQSSGIGVGLQRFGDICDAEQYVQPIVPIAPLPGNLSALQQALPLAAIADTSTIPPLDGALQYARTWAASNSNARVAVVLLTDASPGPCDALSGNYDMEVARVARAAYEGTPSIKTYVIGFSVLPTLDPIPSAGGTELSLISIVPADGEVLTALEHVRQEAQPCAFSWQSGWTPASSSEVVFKASDGIESRYPILANGSECAQQQEGFYVEEPTASYPLIACPRTCAHLTAPDQLTLSSACRAP